MHKALDLISISRHNTLDMVVHGNVNVLSQKISTKQMNPIFLVSGPLICKDPLKIFHGVHSNYEFTLVS